MKTMEVVKQAPQKTKNKYLDSVAYFEKLFHFVNEKLFESELPAVVITIQEDKRNKAYGWFTLQKVWKETRADEGLNEINISAQFLNRSPEELASTLIHELCHFYANIHSIQDTSRSGTYHNKLFAKIAEVHGLHVDCEKGIGWSRTSLTDETKSLLHPFFENNPFPLFYRTVTAKGKALKSSSTRKYECPICLSSCRATKELRLICADCNKLMVLAD